MLTLGYIYSSLKIKNNFSDKEVIKSISYVNKIKKNNIINNSRIVFL